MEDTLGDEVCLDIEFYLGVFRVVRKYMELEGVRPTH
jgi:hypothetical protein